MQNIKDSFYVALRDRLAALAPARVVTVQGVVRPAIVVQENELPEASGPLAGVFYLHWKEVEPVPHVDDAPQPLLQLQCEVAYWTEGSEAESHQDRGRALAGHDDELLGICHPRATALRDFTQTPAQDRAQNIFWTRPRLGPLVEEGRRLMRIAQVQVFAFAEVDS